MKFLKERFFVDLLKIRYPIVQAPMAGADNPAFVAAACNAGVLGSLGAQYKSPSEIKSAIEEIRRLTDKPFAVNLFALSDEQLHRPLDSHIERARNILAKYYEYFGIEPPSDESVKSVIDPLAQMQVLIDERVPVFSFTLGLPQKHWLDKFKAASITTIGTATNLNEARLIESAGVDIVCAQGSEAGGHRGTFLSDASLSMIGTVALVSQIVDAVEIPVLASGGIMNGASIAAAMTLGACGVQMGTAFLTTSECPIHPAYKSAIQNQDGDNTAITKVFSGGAARGIMNQFMLDNNAHEILPFPFHNALTKPFRKVANDLGQIQYTNLWSGQAGGLARQMSIEELIQTLWREVDDAKAR